MTLPTKRNPANVLMTVGFLFFFKDRVRVSSIRELMQLARHLKTDLLFYFDYSPLQVITNISSHITQPVKRFSHYVMMCLFGQLHIREKSILTYVFLKGSMSSVKSCGLVYFVKCKLHVLFAIELKKLLWTTKSQLLVQQICLARIIYNVTHNKLMNFEKLLGQEVLKNHNRNHRFVDPCLFMCLPCYLHLFYRFKQLFLFFTWSEMSSVSSPHPPPVPLSNGRQCERDSQGVWLFTCLHVLAMSEHTAPFQCLKFLFLQILLLSPGYFPRTTK